MSAKSVTKSDSADNKSAVNAKPKKKKQAEGTRETVESIAIAFILAFLFKTFQAEAYVIPTGSMAPTLYGRHKEVQCDGCGFKFALGASSEIDQMSSTLMYRIRDVFCSNCGKQLDGKDAPVFNGDRILVNKQVASYERFDVVVFKNPEQGHVNYIKRLVGLPGETIRVRKGDIWALKPDAGTWQVQRKKDPFIQKAIQLTVYDDQYPPRPLIELGWPERWEPSVSAEGTGTVGGWKPAENGWSPNRDDRTYAFDIQGKDAQWLRYRHFMPNYSTWPDPNQVNPDRVRPEARLIADFCSFNAATLPHMPFDFGVYWVGDLTVNASLQLDTVSADSAIVLELVEGPQIFRCSIDAHTGTAELSVLGAQDRRLLTKIASGATPITGVGNYDLTFANVDDRICLWVDGELIEFDATTEYESVDVPLPTSRDLAPVGIAVQNATGVVSKLFLQRDIYYRNDVVTFDPEDGIAITGDERFHVRGSTYNSLHRSEVYPSNELHSHLNNPEAYASIYAQQTAEQISSFGDFGDYVLGDDEYLMFGDNSSMSKDSRLFDYESRPMNGIFSHRYAVREKDLIGKALFIFWPHGIPFMNDGKGISVWSHKGETHTDAKNYPYFRIPFYPNISRMKKIR